MNRLIIGPSSVGKSTYISKELKKHTKNGSLKNSMLFAGDVNPFSKILNNSSGLYIHFNICRFLDLKASKVFKTYRYYFMNFFEFSDPVWENLLSHNKHLHATVLITSKKTLIDRVKTRTVLEENIDSKNKYPSKKWLKIYKKLNLEKRYRKIFTDLEKHGIKYLIIDSSSQDYKEIKSLKSAFELING